MRILLTGGNGQVGSALQATLPQLGDLTALGRSEIDLSNADSIREAVRAAKPDVIVNAAAYTAVDRAETEAAAAFAVNRDGPAVLAQEAARHGALLVHFSTDYVFDGEKDAPYRESDAPNPLNTYGRSKLAGEQAIQASGCRHLVLRTSWVYAAAGRNFLLTMLRMANGRKELRVVDDQRGAPTSSYMIARGTAQAIAAAAPDRSAGGLYHMTAGGNTTWCGFARAIFEARKLAVAVTAISSDDYPTPARRPHNSVLDNARLAQRLGVRLPSWDEGLREVLGRLQA